MVRNGLKWTPLDPYSATLPPLLWPFKGIWLAQYAIERLREALDDIAEALGLIHRGVRL